MNPHSYYTRMFSSSRSDEVFVVMSFDARFDSRWEQIFEPLIRLDLGLTPVRVDYQRSGESTYTAILDGIARAKLVLVDITATWMWDDKKEKRWAQRNANVAWELGVAQVIKVPDEVLIVKSDSQPAMFDLVQFQVMTFVSDPPEEARSSLAKIAQQRLDSVAWMRSHRIDRLVASLTVDALPVLTAAAGPDGLVLPSGAPVAMAGWLAARRTMVAKLLELGALEVRWVPTTLDALNTKQGVEISSLGRYHATELGEAIIVRMSEQLGVEDELLTRAKRRRDESR